MAATNVSRSDGRLTEKLFRGIIYIVLGFIAFECFERAVSSEKTLFLLALVVLYIIIKLATTKIPLLG